MRADLPSRFLRLDGAAMCPATAATDKHGDSRARHKARVREFENVAICREDKVS